MNHDSYDENYLRSILTQTQTIALLGASPKPERASNSVMRFLLQMGYGVYPINPGQVGKEILGQKVYARLSDVPVAIDMIDVFRASEYLSEVVDDALALDILPKVIWGQIGVRDDAAAAKAETAGVKIVMDHCPAIEYPRLNISREIG